MMMKSLISTAIAIIGLAMPLFAQDLPAYVPSEGLVGWWPFNGNANDESGNGNNGTVNGASLTSDRNGITNSAYSFDGQNDNINFGNSTLFEFGQNNFTISFWFRTEFSQFAPLLCKRKDSPTFDQYSLFLGTIIWPNSNPSLAVNCLFKPSPGDPIVYDRSIFSSNLNNSWHYVQVIHSFADSTSLYIDGIYIGMSNTTYTTENFDIAGANLLLGFTNILGQNHYFNGQMDDIGIWNRALTQQEITDLYNSCQISLNSQPTNQPINVNNNAQFIVSSSDPSATYQWQTDLGVGFQNINDVGQYTGATSSTLTVSNVSLTNNNQPFRCIVTSGACSDTSDVAVLTVVDGGLCSGEVVYGCEYLTACNYNAEATVGDGSCIFPEPNYDCEGNCLLDANMNGICDQLETVGPTYCGEGTIWDAALNLCIGFNDCLADFDNSGAVDVADILVFLSLFGNVCD